MDQIPQKKFFAGIYWGTVSFLAGALSAHWWARLSPAIARRWTPMGPSWIGWGLLSLAAIGLMYRYGCRVVRSIRYRLLDTPLLILFTFIAGLLWIVGRRFWAIGLALLGTPLTIFAICEFSFPTVIADTHTRLRRILGLLGQSTTRKTEDTLVQPPIDPGALFSSDAPIHSFDTDWIGRGDLVNRIIALLTDGVVSGHPLPVVALTGPLGSGKTSVLRLVERRLKEEHPSVIPVYFSAWLPPDGPTFAAQMLGSIEDAVARRYVIPHLTRGTRRFISILSGSLKTQYSAPLDRMLHHDSQTDQVEAFCRALDQLPAPVLVLVDELDRMQAEELHALFKILRGLDSQKRLRFLCALDIDHVARTLAGSAPPSEVETVVRDRYVYLEKFFPYVLPLPDIESESWRRACIGAIGTAIDKGYASSAPGAEGLSTSVAADWEYYSQAFSTPRRAKAVIGRFFYRLNSLADECNAADLFHLSVIEVIAPDVAGLIRENHAYFEDNESFRVSDPTLELAPESKSRWQETRVKFYAAHFPNATNSVRIEHYILTKLFPGFAAWTGAAHMPSSDDLLKLAEGTRRMWIPDYFGRYFSERVAAAKLSERERKKLVHELSNATSRKAAADCILRVFEIPQRTFMCLQGMPDRLVMGSFGWHGFIDAAINLPAERLHGESYERLIDVLRILNMQIQKFSKEENERTVADIIKNSEDICLPALIVKIMHRSGSSSEDIDKLMAERFRQDYHPGTEHPSPLDLDDPELAIMVFEVWTQFAEAAALTSYLRWEIDRSPVQALRLIDGLCHRRFKPDSDKAVELGKKFYGSPEDLLKVAEGVDSKSRWQSASLGAFRSSVEASINGRKRGAAASDDGPMQ